MKRVLITGANSYVGTNVEKWLMREPNKYYVETLDMKDQNWKNFDFSRFDVVFHVAGIAHVSAKKSMKDLYYQINTNLVIETANIAKTSGVKQFIFMSSMIVFNSDNTIITKETIPNPNNFYGDSKLQAEKLLKNIESPQFIISILRPPMIYGSSLKGNMVSLYKLTKLLHFFPKYINKRSVLNIQNLTRFIEGIIQNNLGGYFYPQDKELVSTHNLVFILAKRYNYKVFYIRIFNPLIRFLVKRSSRVSKVFGDKYYDITTDICNYVDTDEI